MPYGLSPIIERFAEGAQSGAALCAPPKGFRTAEDVRAAWPVGDGPFGRTSSRSGTIAQKMGRRYEKKALGFLKDLLGNDFRASQWFRFQNSSDTRWCQVDGLLLQEKSATIFEIKYSFCTEAWWQLRRLYEPVVRRAFLIKDVNVVIVCRNYDPAILLPEQVFHTSLLAGWQEALNGRVGIFQWKP